MDKNGIPCKRWQDRSYDWFTDWKDEYKHRTMCYSENEFCEECDTDEKLAEFQALLTKDAKSDKPFSLESSRILSKHIVKWGDKRATKG